MATISPSNQPPHTHVTHAHTLARTLANARNRIRSHASLKHSTAIPIITSLVPTPLTDDDDTSWKDVHRNIKHMDQLYDATFHSWLKSEDNVLVTSVYLHRIANEYPLPRVVNALKWLISDWRLESISVLVRHVTMDWNDEIGKFKEKAKTKLGKLSSA